METGGATTGFDYLRLGLSLAVLFWHSISAAYGGAAETPIWTGPLRSLPAAILPMFFALSGFLVAGSLLRTRLYQFLGLRFLRIFPALGVEITLSALLLGPILTTLPLAAYFSAPEFRAYFLNAIGWIHYTLPGVIDETGAPRIINGQLWTIPFELECYITLAVLALVGLTQRPKLFAAAIVALAVVLTVLSYTTWPVDPTTRVPGRMLVLCFLAGVALHLLRAVVPCTNGMGLVAIVLTVVGLTYVPQTYAAALPIAYLTVWLGLMRPRAIPFGDLSYGIFLFHFPILQTVAHFWPGEREWWIMAAVALPLTTAFAACSWFLIERPLLNRKKAFIAGLDRIAEGATAALRRR
jgi:peptidoglycan/LPS O-acetylase OafA/YrhL